MLAAQPPSLQRRLGCRCTLRSRSSLRRIAAEPHRHRPTRATPTAQEQASAQQQAAYQQLLLASGTTTILDMRVSSVHQNGLFTKQPVQKGEVLMSVPGEVCLIIDYNNGLSAPSSGSWPQLKEGLTAAEPLTWDLLMALALLDGLAGDGGAFWKGYCEAILPAPESLTLPMCWSRQRMEQLQHDAIKEAALQQQDRLANMFPDLQDPIADDMPSWMQWAFACVRSRAYKLGPDIFAMVPFWDLANHGVQPNSDFRADLAGKGPLQLVAVKDIPADTEVLISYTGTEGYTNQRLMAQYGFVIPGGNPADRVPLDTAEATDARSSSLSLERIQELMGDLIFLEVISAQNAYGYAALKSLPIVDENVAGSEVASTSSGNSSSSSSSSSGAKAEHSLCLARKLMDQCAVLTKGSATTLEEDEAELQEYRSQRKSSIGTQLDERAGSALEYRVERKRLLKACFGILELYVAGE